jgi:hypothetical protein
MSVESGGWARQMGLTGGLTCAQVHGGGGDTFRLPGTLLQVDEVIVMNDCVVMSSV